MGQGPDIHDKYLRELASLRDDVKYWKEFGSFFLGEYCHLVGAEVFEAWLAFEEWYDDKHAQGGKS